VVDNRPCNGIVYREEGRWLFYGTDMRLQEKSNQSTRRLGSDTR